MCLVCSQNQKACVCLCWPVRHRKRPSLNLSVTLDFTGISFPSLLLVFLSSSVCVSFSLSEVSWQIFNLLTVLQLPLLSSLLLSPSYCPSPFLSWLSLHFNPILSALTWDSTLFMLAPRKAEMKYDINWAHVTDTHMHKHAETIRQLAGAACTDF